MTDEATLALVYRWQTWVAELEDHPLDVNEYEGLLRCRDDLAYRLAVTGDCVATDQVEATDHLFQEVTEESSYAGFDSIRGAGWWWNRLPAGKNARDYFLGIY